MNDDDYTLADFFRSLLHQAFAWAIVLLFGAATMA